MHDLAVAIAEADVALSAALGTTTGDYLAVKHVLLRPGELGPVELGRLLGMSSGSATALVDRLAAAGHVVRLPHDHDRRRRVLLVSDGTRARLLAELERRAADIEDLARAYDDDQRRAITSFLGALAARHRARPGPRGRPGP
ncbi:MarR family transcriptional regulator [Pseudonocardia sp. S2-4]|uniref:MarR family transcriptional regulator n=1 Tax=Pseudonocardia humida TaxID=2800819 RepID=A0ABT1A3P3_9PSEU|nr:MarR family transcriptional regulator [Pseudonocardia humida]